MRQNTHPLEIVPPLREEHTRFRRSPDHHPVSSPSSSAGFCCCVLALVLSVVSAAQADMTIRNYDSARHDRYYSGGDKAFVGAAFDWSGVGKDATNHWVTMISQSYFLSAAHWAPSGNVTFYEGNSKSEPFSHVYTIASGAKLGGTDLWLGKLTTALDASHNIAYYPILTLDSSPDYFGMEIYNYGLQDRVGRNVIDDNGIRAETLEGSTGATMLYDYDNNDTPSVGGDETYLISGDSGGPSFANWDGELALLGIHWFNGTYTNGTPVSGDTFVPAYFSDIAGNMIGENPTAVPEPATWIFCACGGLALYARRCRRRKSVRSASSIGDEACERRAAG